MIMQQYWGVLIYMGRTMEQPVPHVQAHSMCQMIACKTRGFLHMQLALMLAWLALQPLTLAVGMSSCMHVPFARQVPPVEAYTDAQPARTTHGNGFVRLDEDPLYGR